MSNNDLFFIGTEGGLANILKIGILPPTEVFKLIDEGTLNEETLGCSARGRDCSFTPDHVSLESHNGGTLYMPFNLYLRNRVPVIFKLKDSIRQDPNFENEIESKRHKISWETGLCLYKGTIPKSQIHFYGTLKRIYRDAPEVWDYINAYDFHTI